MSLSQHNHGKTQVRVCKVRRTNGLVHEIAEFTVLVTIYNPGYDVVFTKGDNTNLVATDTMRNTVYVIAKSCPCESPEQFALAYAAHMLKKYHFLVRCDVSVVEHVWDRAEVGGKPHNHSFVRREPERNFADVEHVRDAVPRVTSGIKGLVVLKTTQSGFEGFLRNEHTSLPEVRERIMSTSMTAVWRATSQSNYVATRSQVRQLLLEGFFGEAERGVYSPSVQATVYETGQLVLKRLPHVHSIFIDTPNVHYLPAPLDKIGLSFDDEVFQPTSEPSGTICMTVSRSGNDHYEDSYKSRL